MFKRYMVFSWDEYDNADPFDCVIFHTDVLEEAKAKAKDDDSYGVCIFDRVNGTNVNG